MITVPISSRSELMETVYDFCEKLEKSELDRNRFVLVRADLILIASNFFSIQMPQFDWILQQREI